MTEEELYEHITEKVASFSDIKSRMDNELAKQGFAAEEPSPVGEPPKIKSHLTKKKSSQLRDMYDDLMAWYDYLDGEAIRNSTQLATAKKKLKIVDAELILYVNKFSDTLGLSNAEQRAAWVERHPLHIVVSKDILFFSEMAAANDSRKKKISKSMERIWREITARKEVPKYNGPMPRTYGVPR